MFIHVYIILYNVYIMFIQCIYNVNIILNHVYIMYIHCIYNLK